MADLAEMAAELRRRAQSAREVGDSYDEVGQPEIAARLWGTAHSYLAAAKLVEREAKRDVK